MMDLTENYLFFSIRYDVLTKANIAVWMAFLLCMAILRRGIK